MEENQKILKGNIHSLESFGTVDGPGIRLVVFFQGCPMRCQYCHNPDTWEPGKGTQMSVDEILALYEKNKSFYRNGGLTVTGGEPLLQLDFLTELFREAKKRGIHTCLDTSGIMYQEKQSGKFEALFSYTDLVLLDLKHSDPEEHQKLTRQRQESVLAFAQALARAGVPVIIRHVVVPGITDGKAHLERIGEIIAPLRNLKGLEVLPYHTMGVNKYKMLGMEYPLDGVEPLDKEKALEARKVILETVREIRNGKK